MIKPLTFLKLERVLVVLVMFSLSLFMASCGDDDNDTVAPDDDVVTPTEPVNLPITFEDETVAYNFENFADARTTVEDNPASSGINTSTKVAKTVKTAGALTYAGSFITLENPIDFGSNNAIKMKVNAGKLGTVKLKLENLDDPNINTEVDVESTVTGEWEELVFAYNEAFLGASYSKIVVFFDFGSEGDGTEYLFDDIELTTGEAGEVIEFGEDLENISPATMGHTFESAESFDLLGTVAGASVITTGEDDPTDATATKVGKYTRIAADFQEAMLRVAPDPLDIEFSTITTVTAEVFLPSTNDYSGGLTQKFIIGFADQSQTEEWWTNIIQYESEELPLDEWTTVTFDLTADASFSSNDGQKVADRDDLDMIFLQFGGGGHSTEASFFIKDLSFE